MWLYRLRLVSSQYLLAVLRQVELGPRSYALYKEMLKTGIPMVVLTETATEALALQVGWRRGEWLSCFFQRSVAEGSSRG